MKKTTIEHKKLGRNKALGLAFKDENLIHLDERLKGKEYLLVAIHELLHIYKKEYTEEEVEKFSQYLADNLWKLKFRKTEI